jgi:outer membrane receptor protein involved in Fe transport
MFSGVFRCICALWVVLLFTCFASAQSEVGTTSLNGVVKDPSGAAVANAQVTARSSATGFVRQTVSTGTGLYNLTGLPVGTYEVIVETAGFKTTRVPNINLSVGAAATLNINLQIGTSTTEVNVVSDAPLVETSRTVTSTAISTQQVENLPVNGRNFLDFTLLTPGVVRDPTRSGDLSFGGQRGTSNSLLIDGSDANNNFYGQSVGRAGTGRNPYSFSEDAIQEFQVNTNNYAAEIGRAGGGVINVITKSGTNAFHGDAFEFYRDKSLNANTWDNNTTGRPKRAYHFNQFGGDIGGPILKNKTFFFFDYDGQRNTTPNIVIPGAFPADATGRQALAGLGQYLTPYVNSLNNNVYLGKVDWNLTDNQHISFRYNASRFTGLNYENAGATSAQGHTGNSNVTSDNAGFIYTAAFTPNTVLEGRFFYTRDNEPGFANSSAPETVIQQNGQTALLFGRNNFSPRYTNVSTYQPTLTFAITKGAHTTKIGADTIVNKIGNYFPGNFSGSYIFTSFADFASNQPSQFTQAFPGPGTTGATSHPNVNEYAFFVEDSWRVTSNFTLNYGLRYDLFDYAQPPVLNPNGGLYAAGLSTNRIHTDKADYSPRFGFAWSPTNDSRTVLRGGYGIFYAVTPSIFTGTAFTQNGIQVQTFTYSGANNIPVTYPNLLPSIPVANRTPSLFIFVRDFRNGQTQQWNFNVERQIGNHYSITLGYLGVKGSHLPRARDINLFPSVPVSGPVQGGGSLLFTRHPNGRPNPNFARIMLAGSGADSIYHAGFVQLTKRFSRDFLVQTSYTWSHAIDDNPDATQVVVGTDDAKSVQDSLLPNLDRGNGNSDVRGRFVFSGVWNWNFVPSGANPILRFALNGWQLSTIATLQTGRPYSSTIGQVPDLNNDGNTRNDRTPGQGRNALRGPNFLNDDVRFSRFFPLGTERVRLQFIGEAFNITNRVNFINLRTTQYNFTGSAFTPLSTFFTPSVGSAAGDPRILQLAAKIVF